jgi:2',3'-cyclic-nucleotide 2'-phosphodiesterase/3'-nucleotidase
VIQGGLTYTIDVTKPAQQRIEDLKLNGKPLANDQAVIVVTNNYRASGGGKFPNLDGSNIVLSAPDANRDALISYVRGKKNITREQFADARNWKFAKAKTGPVTFTSAAGKLEIAASENLPVTLVKENGDGTATYSVDLSK